MINYYQDYDQTAHELVSLLNHKVIIGVPLGIGKPIGLLNALFRLAEKNSSIELTILTGLTLTKPEYTHFLEKRLVEPIIERLMPHYEDLLYEKARYRQCLPTNIKVIEFFVAPGRYLNNSYVQQNFINSNYTSVIRDLSQYGMNVIAQQLAQSSEDKALYSLSSNADLFRGTCIYLKKFAEGGSPIAIVCEVNQNLPFMPGQDSEVEENYFTHVIDVKKYKPLFALPREAISVQEHLIGLHVSTLIKDDSCLQIGIGQLSNGVANALIFRHQQQAEYKALLKTFQIQEKFPLISSLGAILPFSKGIYASTEMVSDEYIALYQAGLLKKKAYDHLGLQILLNKNQIDEQILPEHLDVLLEQGIIQACLRQVDVDFLVHFGFFKAGVGYEDNYILTPAGEKIPADLNDQAFKKQIITSCLGSMLKTGKIIHAAFFIGSQAFYRTLQALSKEEKLKISMTSVARTNALTWNPELLQAQRQQARFVNFAMMVCLDGSVVSDSLHDFKEVSGIGGQFDFVLMANGLSQARSIIVCRSTRETSAGLKSNIVWNYSSVTIPRCLRDIVVTEYGIADCRGKTDSEVIKALLNITDSRFQINLLKIAKNQGKIPNDYEIPAIFKQNYPDKFFPIIAHLQKKGFFSVYPFGSDLTEVESLLAHSLLFLKKSRKTTLLLFMIRSMFFIKRTELVNACLVRIQLDRPRGLKEFLYKKLFAFTVGYLSCASSPRLK